MSRPRVATPRPPTPARLSVLVALLLAWDRAPPEPVLRIDLARSTWTLNGAAPETAPGVAPDAAPGEAPGEAPPAAGSGPVGALVTLPCIARGVRWATSFDTESGRMSRLSLDWAGGPDGLLFEVVVDGQRLLPARDAWRPSPRGLRSDLGSLWLGPGGHLFEIVAREQPAGPSAVRLASLEVEWLSN